MKIISLILALTSVVQACEGGVERPHPHRDARSRDNSFRGFFHEYVKKPKKHGQSMILDVEYSLALHKEDLSFLSVFKSQTACGACGTALAPIDYLLKNKFITGILEEVALGACEVMKIEGGIHSVCKGAIDMMATPLLPAVADGLLSKFRICDEYFHLCTKPAIKELSADGYVKAQLAAKPAIIKNNDFVNDLYRKIANDTKEREIVRSIQLSDPHIDFKYKEGAPTQCSFPICCRDNGPEEKAASGSGTAGKWGDYDCDIPHSTLRSMFEFIGANQHILKTDFITWVGDNSAHNVWDNTNEEVTEYTNNITTTLREALGAESKIQVYPSLGNHDTWPVNVQDFSTPDSNWPINHIKGNWSGDNWLSEEEVEVFGKYGYYSKPLPFNSKGRVISLNTQACNDLNWWLLDNRQDPGLEMQWLEQELSQLEKDGGFAYMIGHIPVSGCLHQFGVRYKALMERYQHIVRFSSFGHSHDENFYITRAFNSSEAIGVNLISGSGTSGGNRNPAFTVIDWDKEYMVPVNIHTYFMNLTEANAAPNSAPVWRVLHDFKDEYQLKDLSPASMQELANRMYNDVDLAAQFEWNSNRRGGAGAVKPSAKLHDQDYLCMQTSETFERKDCYGQPHIHLSFSDTTSMFEYFIGNWITVGNSTDGRH